jgi:hypothetical protein
MRSLAVVMVVVGAATAARAEPWKLGAELRTDFPLDVGGTLWAEGRGRVQLSLGVGWLPGTYVDAIDSTVVAFGGMSRGEADLVRVALRSSAVARAHVGWRPLAEHGLYLDGGYGMVALGGGATTAQLITAVTGAMPPSGSVDRPYRVYSTLHMLDAEVGWRWRLDAGLTLRAAIGFAGTFAASSDVRPDFMPTDPAKQQVYTDLAAKKLDAIYTSYVFTPVFSVASGWEF